MQDGEFDKTRVIHAPPVEEPKPQTEGPDPNQTMMIQPTARAAAAANALADAKRAREAARKTAEFQWSGEVDFDLTSPGTLIPPPRRDWKKLALWGLAGAAVLLVVVIAFWWGGS